MARTPARPDRPFKRIARMMRAILFWEALLPGAYRTTTARACNAAARNSKGVIKCDPHSGDSPGRRRSTKLSPLRRPPLRRSADAAVTVTAASRSRRHRDRQGPRTAAWCRQLSAGALGSLARCAGRPGPQGAPGPKGDPGKQGPSALPVRPATRDRRGRRASAALSTRCRRAERPEGSDRRRSGELHLGKVASEAASPSSRPARRCASSRARRRLERHQHRLSVQVHNQGGSAFSAYAWVVCAEVNGTISQP